MSVPILVFAYIVSVNVFAFMVFRHDKLAAVNGQRRVSEDRLLAIAFLGGSIGAKIGQMALRHKTRKEPFRQQLNGIVAVQILAAAAALALGAIDHSVLWVLPG